jgi:hypothetical protein
MKGLKPVAGDQLRTIVERIEQVVTGGVNPRIDGEVCSGDVKGAVEAPGLFTGTAV